MNYISLYAYQRYYHRISRTNKNKKNELKVRFPIIELNTYIYQKYFAHFPMSLLRVFSCECFLKSWAVITFQFLILLPMTPKSLFIMVLFSTLLTNATVNFSHFYYLLLFL